MLPEATDQSSLSPSSGRRFGSYEVIAILRQEGDWFFSKCRRDDGVLALVKAVNTSAAHALSTLRHEVSLLVQLAEPGHEGVVRILDWELGARAWHATAWVDGWPLSREISGGPMPLARVVRIGCALAEALEYVHAHGIVHGDISPNNVLTDQAGNATLIDLGAATLLFEAEGTREVGHAGDPHYGTPGYVAPERLKDGLIDARSDLYSLGCVLHELVTGKPAVRADDALRKSTIGKLIIRLLARDPAERFRTAAEVRGLLTALEQQSPRANGPRTLRTFPLHRSRLIGREAALDTLLGALGRAAARNPQRALVAGESGIGKTSLLNEVGRLAKTRGFEVSVGRCYDLSASRGTSPTARQALGPFLPVLSWIADTLNECPAPLQEELRRALAVLANYSSSLRDMRTAPPAPLPPALARARVLQSLATALALGAAERSLLLIVDDVQWADDLSMAFLLGDQIRTLVDCRLCLVVAYRSDELATDIQRELSARASSITPLERLGTDEVALLAGSLLGSKLVPAQVSEVLYRRSDGNPFLVVQYLYSLLQEGVLAQSADEARAVWLTRSVQQLDVPVGLKDLFEVRVRDLSSAARRIIELAAVLGSEFRGDILERSVTGVEGDVNTPLALWELSCQRLIESLPNGRYRFVHDKIREAQLSALAPEERRAHHQRVAELLCSDPIFAANDAELGVHFAEAGLPARALPCLEAAANEAARRYANAEAIDLYALALAQLELLSTDTPEIARHSRAMHLGEARGDLLSLTGRNDEACKQYAAAAARAGGTTRARLQRKQSTAARTAHDYAAATVALDAAEDALTGAGGAEARERTSEWIEIQQSRFWLHYFARQAGPLTDTVLRRLKPVVEQCGTALQRSMFFECIASHLMARDQYLFSLDVVDSARRGLDELHNEDDQTKHTGSIRFVLAFALMLGDSEHCREAVRLFDENIKELEPIGDAPVLSRSLVYQSLAYRRLGDADRAKLASRRARLYAERVQLTPYVGVCLACEAWLCWRTEELLEAERLASEARMWWQKSAHVFPFRWTATFVLLAVHHVRDDFLGAKAALDDLLEPTQMRFAEPLATALVTAQRACESADARAASRQLGELLTVAHAHGYL